MRHLSPWKAGPGLLICLVLPGTLAVAGVGPLGMFEGHQDIGSPSRPGTAHYDAAHRTYRVLGGGENMWFTNDAFHLVWKEVSGDLTLSAAVVFASKTGHAHRKACLMVRQSLDPDSAYADAALHGDGLTSLQYRENKGALTREIQSAMAARRRLRLEKRGKYVSVSVAAPGGELRPAGGAFRLVLGRGSSFTIFNLNPSPRYLKLPSSREGAGSEAVFCAQSAAGKFQISWDLDSKIPRARFGCARKRESKLPASPPTMGP